MNARTAIALLFDDTGKWPLGCTSLLGDTSDQLDHPQTGLKTVPSVGTQGPGCTWTAADIAKWKGPYMTVPAIDPWGQPYEFDSDYFFGRDCIGHPNFDVSHGFTGPVITAVQSNGPGGAEANPWYYDCDDIYIEIK